MLLYYNSKEDIIPLIALHIIELTVTFQIKITISFIKYNIVIDYSYRLLYSKNTSISTSTSYIKILLTNLSISNDGRYIKPSIIFWSWPFCNFTFDTLVHFANITYHSPFYWNMILEAGVLLVWYSNIVALLLVLM